MKTLKTIPWLVLVHVIVLASCNASNPEPSLAAPTVEKTIDTSQTRIKDPVPEKKDTYFSTLYEKNHRKTTKRNF